MDDNDGESVGLACLTRKPDQKPDLKRSEGETAAAETSGAFYLIINRVGRGELDQWHTH